MKKALKTTGKNLLGILITLVAAIMILLVARLIGKAINIPKRTSTSAKSIASYSDKS